MVAGKLMAEKFYPKSYTQDKKSTFFKKKLNLKGRSKKNPNNINYNDLFKENEEKHPMMKKGRGSNEMIHDNDNGNEDKHCKNLDDFLERVNEKKEFQKFFNDGNPNINMNMNMNGEYNLNRNLNQNGNENKQISIVLKNNEENLIMFDEHCKKNSTKDSDNKFYMQETDKELLIDHNHYDIMIDKNLENSIEIRKKNPSLYYKTPLANIRKNTMSSQK